MPFQRLSGARIVCALSLCLSLALPGAAGAVEAEHPLAWRDAKTLPALVDTLETWLDAQTDLTRRTDAPSIRWISEAQAAAINVDRHSARGGRTRAFYDPDTASILLVRPWDAGNPYDVSVLLHELVHHRQAEAGHWYCPGAQELPAYRLQQAWLNGMGLEPDVNWIAVVLEAGCTPRDIHPD